MNHEDKSNGNKNRQAVRFLVFSASMRIDSLNTRLARLAARKIEEQGGIVTFAGMKDFDCPSFNQDIQDNEVFPPGAETFNRQIIENDAIVISSPEYNASMPGVIKNAIDWVSRYKPQPFNEKHALLMSASPSMAGGNRGLWALRIPLEHLGARVYPDMFSLAAANQALDDSHEIANPALRERFENCIINFMDLVEAARHYKCMKKQWIEFLGEQPNPVIDRVE